MDIVVTYGPALARTLSGLGSLTVSRQAYPGQAYPPGTPYPGPDPEAWCTTCLLCRAPLTAGAAAGYADDGDNTYHLPCLRAAADRGDLVVSGLPA